MLAVVAVLLGAVVTANRLAFRDDPFARRVLWVIALPLSAYLLRLVALHWGG